MSRAFARSLALAFVLLVPAAVAAPAHAEAGGAITGHVWKDLDRDGVVDAGEESLAGRQLYLFDGSGAYLTTVLADADGAYAFGGLADGAYRVEMTSADWWALRLDWAPTTTPALFPRQTVQLAGSAVADFGWRPIARSTNLASPISSYRGPSGLTVDSYNDVVAAREIHDAVAAGLVGEEAPYVTIRFDYGATSSCPATIRSQDGVYVEYAAACYIAYEAWLDGGHVPVGHEYGHAWAQYYTSMAQQDLTYGAYIEARGLAGDPRVGTSYAWDPAEMIAEDYRQLFASPAARAAGQINRDIPTPDRVPGLREFLLDTFTQPVAPPPPSPAPVLTVDGLSVAPSPVRKTGTVSFTLSAPATVTVSILSAGGSTVRVLINQASLAAGTTSVIWDKKSSTGRRVAPGVYTVRVEATGTGGTATATRSFTVA